jgi:hypothetical protein
MFFIDIFYLFFKKEGISLMIKKIDKKNLFLPIKVDKKQKMR